MSERTVVISHAHDPISYTMGTDRMLLRIGGEGRGEGREAFLTRKQARILAYALLTAAEDLSNDPD
jgi:hypothetical protein